MKTKANDKTVVTRTFENFIEIGNTDGNLTKWIASKPFMLKGHPKTRFCIMYRPTENKASCSGLYLEPLDLGEYESISVRMTLRVKPNSKIGAISRTTVATFQYKCLDGRGWPAFFSPPARCALFLENVLNVKCTIEVLSTTLNTAPQHDRYTSFDWALNIHDEVQIDEKSAFEASSPVFSLSGESDLKLRLIFKRNKGRECGEIHLVPYNLIPKKVNHLNYLVWIEDNFQEVCLPTWSKNSAFDFSCPTGRRDTQFVTMDRLLHPDSPFVNRGIVHFRCKIYHDASSFCVSPSAPLPKIVDASECLCDDVKPEEDSVKIEEVVSSSPVAQDNLVVQEERELYPELPKLDENPLVPEFRPELYDMQKLNAALPGVQQKEGSDVCKCLSMESTLNVQEKKSNHAYERFLDAWSSETIQSKSDEVSPEVFATICASVYSALVSQGMLKTPDFEQVGGMTTSQFSTSSAMGDDDELKSPTFGAIEPETNKHFVKTSNHMGHMNTSNRASYDDERSLVFRCDNNRDFEVKVSDLAVNLSSLLRLLKNNTAYHFDGNRIIYAFERYTPNVVKSFVRYLKVARIGKSEVVARELAVLANDLKMPKLKRRCLRRLLAHLDDNNFMSLMILASECDMPELHEKALELYSPWQSKQNEQSW